ncbi:hypothetical protein DL764_006022 [Monosporascus ibericus]|uniref:Uncharacterized protein n=1 Tax=Monosporascus ibericus TaxID=155417 RepID=A0A4Q4T9P6_9PEZI|nr:hypothetical protein DL764_006022 [Monosporascus ibericus]
MAQQGEDTTAIDNTQSSENGQDGDINLPDHKEEDTEQPFGGLNPDLTTPDPLKDGDGKGNDNDGAFAQDTIAQLRETPFPEPSNNEDHNLITLYFDPDVKEKRVKVKGWVEFKMSFRGFFFVILPSLTEANTIGRAVLVRSSDYLTVKQNFSGETRDVSPEAELIGCHWEEFEVMLVAVSDDNKITYCVGRPKTQETRGLYSKSTLDKRFGRQRVDNMLNSHRELVGQGKIPRPKRVAKTQELDDDDLEYRKRVFERWAGQPPKKLKTV